MLVDVKRPLDLSSRYYKKPLTIQVGKFHEKKPSSF